MKFTINKSALLKALTLTGQAIAQKSIVPILSDYLFNIDGSNLTVTGGSEGLFVSTSLEIMDNMFAGSIAIPANKLLSIVKALPDQPLYLTVTETKQEKTVSKVLNIKASSGNYNIPVEDGKDYPSILFTDPVSFDLDFEPALRSINKTLFACSLDDLRPALTGLYIAFKANEAHFVGCNGSLISISSCPIYFATDKNVIVPPKALAILKELPASEKLHIAITTRSIQIKTDDGVEINALLIDENYVGYEAVIPTTFEKHAIADIAQLIGSIKRVSLFSEIGTDVIKIAFSKNNCILSVINTLGESASEEISVQYDGEDIEYGISAKQFTTCLSKLDKPEANILMIDAKRAIVLADEPSTVESKKDFVLVMPFKVPF